MPILHVTNQTDGEDAQVEHRAQVNKIEEIQINGVSLTIENKQINIPLASTEDIDALFAEGV